MKKAISIILIFAMIFSMVGVLALPNQAGNRYIATEKVNKQALEQVQNAFQNRYKFSCSGNCTYSGFDENVKLQVQERINLFQNKNINLGFNVKDEYVLDEDGKILQEKHNIWSRIMNNLNRRNYL
jgi:type II secretory pathway pseudopilin PulG